MDLYITVTDSYKSRPIEKNVDEYTLDRETEALHDLFLVQILARVKFIGAYAN